MANKVYYRLVPAYHVQLWYQQLSRAVMISVVITYSNDISRYHVQLSVQLWNQSLSRAVLLLVVIKCSTGNDSSH